MVLVLLGLAGIGLVYLVPSYIRRFKRNKKITRRFDARHTTAWPELIIWDDLQGPPPTPEQTQKMREWYEASPFNYKVDDGVGGEQDKDSGDNR